MPFHYNGPDKAEFGHICITADQQDSDVGNGRRRLVSWKTAKNMVWRHHGLVRMFTDGGAVRLANDRPQWRRITGLNGPHGSRVLKNAWSAKTKITKMAYRSPNNHVKNTSGSSPQSTKDYKTQSCPWVQSTHELGWVGFGQLSQKYCIFTRIL